MTDFSDFVENIKESVVKIGKSFTKSDDTWIPVLIFKNKYHSGVFDISNYIAEDTPAEEYDHFCTELLPKLILKEQATELCFVLISWALDIPKDQADEILKLIEENNGDIPPFIEENSDKREVIRVIGMKPGLIEMWIAPIGRDPLGNDPPTLGEFELIGKETFDSQKKDDEDVHLHLGTLLSFAYMAVEFNMMNEIERSIPQILVGDEISRKDVMNLFEETGSSLDEITRLISSGTTQNLKRAFELMNEVIKRGIEKHGLGPIAELQRKIIEQSKRPENPDWN